MNEFSIKPDITELKKPEIENFKSIKPESEISVMDARSFVDGLFEEKFDKKSEALDAVEGNAKGGRYDDLINQNNNERHHMPADSINGLERSDGPAIIMDKADHRLTASCGMSKEAQEYRREQAKLVEKGEFRDAFKMDVDDIRSKFGDKYDDAIAQAEKYMDKIELEGKI